MLRMDDAFEQSDHLLSVIYNRSLLYLISGILEPEEVDSPIAGMLRFDTSVSPFDLPMLTAVRQFLLPGGGQQSTVLARSMVNDHNAQPGFIINPERHQDFTTTATTRPHLVIS